MHVNPFPFQLVSMPEVLKAWDADPIVSGNFVWRAKHKAFMRSCDLSQLPEANAEYNSYINICEDELPSEDHPANFHCSLLMSGTLGFGGTAKTLHFKKKLLHLYLLSLSKAVLLDFFV